MSRPADVHNPFDWKRSLIVDLYVIDGISAEQCDKLLCIVDNNETADRRQGEAELAARAQRQRERPRWKKLLPW